MVISDLEICIHVTNVPGGDLFGTRATGNAS